MKNNRILLFIAVIMLLKSNSYGNPTAITLSNNNIDENQPSETIIGTLSTIDDNGGSYTYSLVNGEGGDDNLYFMIDGDQLKSDYEFNFEARQSYSIRVKTDDGNGGTFEQAFSIVVNNINDVPTGLILVDINGQLGNTIDEGEPIQSFIGYIGVFDDEEHTFSFVEGVGGDDNDEFLIQDFELRSNAVFDYETKSLYNVRIKVDDGNGGTLEQVLTIMINDVNNASIATIANSDIRLFPNPVNATLHLEGIPNHSFVRLVSVHGAIIQEWEDASTNTVLDVSSVPAGMYWITVGNNGSNESIEINRKLIIE